MRIHFGNAPQLETVGQSGEGWRQAPALSARRVQRYGLIVACGSMLLVAALLRGSITPSSIWAALLILVFATPLHEFVHALATPSWGLTDHTVIGFQRGSGLFLPYMYYDGSLPLWRMLLIGLAPIVLLTGLPLSLLLLTPPSGALRADLGYLAFYNAAISGGDLVNFAWILSRVPLRATVQQNGWGLLWKMSPTPSSAVASGRNTSENANEEI